MIIEDPVKAACRERCAGFGDPPCYEFDGTGPVDRPFVWKACSECLGDVGVEAAVEFDESAAIGRLV